jgi:hypothetical protein
VATGDRPALDLSGSANVTVVGFEITAGAAAVAGTPLARATGARRIRLRDDVLHDGPGPLVRLDEGARDVLIEGCLFHGAGEARGQVELAGVADVRLRGSILLADARRAPGAESFVSVGAGPDGPSRDVAIERDIFLRWARAGGRGFVAVGAAGAAGPTAEGVIVENNLMLGGTAAPMGAPLSVAGARAVTVRANTVVGALPATAFALADLGAPGAEAASDLRLHNNIWSDGSGAMAPLSVGPPGGTSHAVVLNNLLWNGGSPIPEGSGPLRAADDPAAVVGDPGLPDPRGAVAPFWDGAPALAGGHPTVDAAFRALTALARTAPGSPAIDRADPDHMPTLDLAGRPRGMPDIGALEHRPVSSSPTPVTPGPATATPGPVRRHLPAALRRAAPAGAAPAAIPHRQGAKP